ncbi:MAG: hypothetical protein LUP94_01250 [Candidatus Methanomethylicus sp.]|nr:hypothetical protein [Candidatus Methanomethylicus sp.]
MPEREIFGLQNSSGGFLLRAVLGCALAFLTYVFLYELPLSVSELLSMGANPQIQQEIAQIAGKLINPFLPLLGLALVPLAFLMVFLRGSKVYGAVLIANGIFSAAYLYLAFQGGQFLIDVPGSVFGSLTGLPEGVQLSLMIKVNLIPLLALFLVPCLLILAKGILLLYRDYITSTT